MSDTALRSAQPGTETRAAQLARVGRWREAEAAYRVLRDAARQEEWTVGLELQSLPISETQGPVVSDRCRALASRRKALMLTVRYLSRAHAACERGLKARVA